MSLLGIAGRGGAGKSTAAEVLVSAGWHRVKFAGPLKTMMRALYAEAGLHADLIEARIEGQLKPLPDPLLGGCTPRRAMQTLGSEWGRNLIDPGLWIGLAQAAIETAIARGQSVVVDDVRFENEAALIRRMGGTVLRIDGRGGIGDHQSERDLPADIVFRNEGPPEVLRGFMAYTFLEGG